MSIMSDLVIAKDTHKQVWAMEQMMKHRLQVDFSRRTIDCRGYNKCWAWDNSSNDFYSALQTAITDIGHANEN